MQAAQAPTSNVLDVVGAHLDGIRLAQNESVGTVGSGAGSSASTTSGVATGEASAANGVWGQVFGGHASQSASSQVDGYSANFGGLMLGYDRTLTDAWHTGGVFSYANTAVNNTGDTAGNTTRINSYGLMAYGGYTAAYWYANLSGGVVLQRYNGERQVDFTGFSGQAGSSYGGTQYVMRGEVGVPLNVGPITVTPLASLTYSYLHQNNYTENGGNGAALAVGSANLASVKSDLGAKFARAFQTSYGMIQPELMLAWRHEYDHARTVTAAAYAADISGTSFTTLGASPVSDLADLSLGVTLLRANNLSLTARYELEAGKGYVSNAGVLKAQQLF